MIFCGSKIHIFVVSLHAQEEGLMAEGHLIDYVLGYGLFEKPLEIAEQLLHQAVVIDPETVKRLSM